MKQMNNYQFKSEIFDLVKIISCEYLEINSQNKGFITGHPVDIRKKFSMDFITFARVIDKYLIQNKIKYKFKKNE